MLDFPNSPSVGQLFPSSNPLWRWDGSEWAPYALYVPSGLSAKQRVFTTVGSQSLSGEIMQDCIVFSA